VFDTVTALILTLALQVSAPQAAPAHGLPLEGAEAERFLTDAKVLKITSFKTKGVTEPRQAILKYGDQELKAVFKDIDEFDRKKELEDGFVLNFRDSYRHEIAAYELDKMLGLGIVPPCVRRRIGAHVGSLCMWIEGTMTEWQRKQERHLVPPDITVWNNQMYTIRLFLQLIDDQDYKNVSNLLVDPDFKIYKIDSSRAFTQEKELRKERSLSRFSRAFLAGLRGMNRETAHERLKKWLNDAQFEALMARRDRILELVQERIAVRGEAEVLYP
jgi:hypothetical protein